MVIDFSCIQGFFGSNGTLNFVVVDETKATRFVRFLVDDDLNVFDSTIFAEHISKVAFSGVLRQAKNTEHRARNGILSMRFILLTTAGLGTGWTSF